MSIKVIDLFCGAGGISTGLLSAVPDAEIECAIDAEPSAVHTYAVNKFARTIGRKAIDVITFQSGRYQLAEKFYKHPEWKNLSRRVHNLRLSPSTEPSMFLSKNPSAARVLVGGPPCQAYSLVGRAKNKGSQGYVPSEDNRHFLYLRYLEFVKTARPEVFIFENVKGMGSASVDGVSIFRAVLNDLANPLGVENTALLSYRIVALSSNKILTFEPHEIIDASPKEFTIRCEELGIPQARHRIIFLGVRHDLVSKLSPIPKAKPQTVEQTISHRPTMRSYDSKNDSMAKWLNQAKTDYLTFEKVARAKGLYRLADTLGGYTDSTIDFHDPFAIPNHNARRHMSSDISRYRLLASCVQSEVLTNAELLDAFSLAPEHANWSQKTKFVDRFTVQKRDSVSKTVVSHIAKDGHYYIHYDPLQARSLSVREAADLQTFPDDFIFCGNVTQQYTQVGNAVPPKLAATIGALIKDVF
jgi:DNA (cytosine-5)-methyltransferase 1